MSDKVAEPPTISMLGRLSKEKRSRAGIGYKKAARAAGICASVLYGLERGATPNLANFRRICEWLDLDPDQVLRFDVAKLGSRPVEEARALQDLMGDRPEFRRARMAFGERQAATP